MGRLIIHAGTHKTGTTTIQRALASRRGKLLARGLWYPGYQFLGRRDHYAHIGMANGLAGDHPNMPPELAQRFFRTVAAKAEEHEVTLVSAEPLYRQVLAPVPPQRMATREEYWQARGAFIAHLRELVGDGEIVLVFRRQADFAESIYQEHVKVTRYSRDFRSFVSEFWFHFLYEEQYRAWAEHFSTVRVLRFEDLAGPNITKRFLLALGIRGVHVPMAEVANVGLAADWVAYKRWLNDTELTRRQLQQLVNTMVEEQSTAQTESRRRFFASLEARRAFQAEFQAGNAALAKAAGFDGPELFEPIEDDGARYGDALGDATRAAMTAQLMAALLEKSGTPRENPLPEAS